MSGTSHVTRQDKRSKLRFRTFEITLQGADTPGFPLLMNIAALTKAAKHSLKGNPIMRLLSQHSVPKLAAFAVFGGLLVAFGANASNGWFQPTHPVEETVQTRSGVTLPSGSWGVVYLNNAREGNLLHLRGIAGAGTLVLRSDAPNECLQSSIELVAGDFGGRSIRFGSTGPIRLAINSRAVAKTLYHGGEIVSADIKVGYGPSQTDADIILLEGLSQSHGFVLDPGHSFWDDLFGVAFKKVTCLGISQAR
ncbi:hypothetical protein [Cohaesibacter celericrescens]|uniref:hypothetical protein n=1 Tax=Cohaesibacter celericrescens TaxID=2067669 RepID=UPI003565B638